AVPCRRSVHRIAGKVCKAQRHGAKLQRASRWQIRPSPGTGILHGRPDRGCHCKGRKDGGESINRKAKRMPSVLAQRMASEGPPWTRAVEDNPPTQTFQYDEGRRKKNGRKVTIRNCDA